MKTLMKNLTKECSFKQIFEEKEGYYPVSELGYFRCDWDGHWWNTVWPVNRKWGTKELIKEFDGVRDAFFREIPTFDNMVKFCRENCEKVGENEYNAFFVGEYGFYWFRFITRYRDYNLYLHCYTKKQ